MKKVYNDIIPPKCYKAFTAWPFLFIRNDLWRWTDEDERHENIHGEQQNELLCVGAIFATVLFVSGTGWWSILSLPLAFYLYGIFYLIGLIQYRNHKEAYRNNPFEAEAYIYEADIYYFSRRRHFAWIEYVFKTTYTNN